MTTPPDRSLAMKSAIFETIKRIHAAHPHLRVGQIIANAISSVPLFAIEDIELRSLLDAHESWLAKELRTAERRKAPGD